MLSRTRCRSRVDVARCAAVRRSSLRRHVPNYRRQRFVSSIMRSHESSPLVRRVCAMPVYAIGTQHGARQRTLDESINESINETFEIRYAHASVVCSRSSDVSNVCDLVRSRIHHIAPHCLQLRQHGRCWCASVHLHTASHHTRYTHAAYQCIDVGVAQHAQSRHFGAIAAHSTSIISHSQSNVPERA